MADIFGEESVQEYADDAVCLFTIHGARHFSASDSVTAKLYELLKRSKRGSVLNRLVQCFLITCPHSMITERAVKHHTILKSELRSSMSRSSVNRRLLIALNSTGTAN